MNVERCTCFFFQRWASLGVPELAIEALGSSEAVFKENGFVCWGLGSLRFIPLAVPSVAETYVHSKMLLPVAFDRMELHHTDPLVLENGLAVLANYQRKQPANSQLFSKQRPDVRKLWILLLPAASTAASYRCCCCIMLLYATATAATAAARVHGYLHSRQHLGFSL